MSVAFPGDVSFLLRFVTWHLSLQIYVLQNAHQSLNQGTNCPVNAHLTPGPVKYFNACIHVYSPKAGANNPLGTNVDVNRKPLSLCPFVASFKTISTLFSPCFSTCIEPRAGADKTLVSKF